MKVLHVYDDRFKGHLNQPGHPERPERLEAVLRGVRSAVGIELIEKLPEVADPELLYLVHRPDYVRTIKEMSEAGGGRLDADTSASASSWEAATLAAGAGPMAVQALEDGLADSAFLSLRPPGHHAERDRAMGFCLFNNVAITAAWLAQQGKRVAVFDWDVHHGNGTQNSLYSDPNILFISVHEYPLYPGTGWLDETGAGDGRGLTVNIPVAAATAGDFYAAATEDLVAPIIQEFRPDWLLVSAGYDAHRRDPLASVRLESRDYAAMTRSLGRVMPANRTIFFLEGGYDLEALEGSARATLESLSDDKRAGALQVGGLQEVSDALQEVSAKTPERGWERLRDTMKIQKPYWKLT